MMYNICWLHIKNNSICVPASKTGKLNKSPVTAFKTMANKLYRCIPYASDQAQCMHCRLSIICCYLNFSFERPSSLCRFTPADGHHFIDVQPSKKSNPSYLFTDIYLIMNCINYLTFSLLFLPDLLSKVVPSVRQ